MDFHVLDEATELPGLGLLLFTEEAAAFQAGQRIRDARGGEHTLLRVTAQEALTVLVLPLADAPAVQKLLRDVRVDGTRFTLL